jgi:hypothetical protein
MTRRLILVWLFAGFLALVLTGCEVSHKEKRDEVYVNFKAETEVKGLYFAYIDRGEIAGRYSYIVYDKYDFLEIFSRNEYVADIQAKNFPYSNNCKKEIIKTDYKFVSHVTFDCNSFR